MRIMVLGAGGFIGRHILSALLAAGHEVTGVVRTIGNLPDAFPQAQFLAVDLAKAIDPADWAGRLEGIDCVVNAAGILRGPTMDAVHLVMPCALHRAARDAGVRHIMLISAISARPDVDTDYSVSKLAGEAVLQEAGLDWTILRPSLVYGDGSYGGTSLIRGMAGLPFVIPVPGQGAFAFTPIHVSDLARDVAAICGQSAFYGTVLEPVGPDTLSLRDILAQYRSWLGFGRARFLPVPMPVMRAMAKVGDVMGDGPIATNSLAQLVAGNAGDSAAYRGATGTSSRSLGQALQAHPAQVQDRWHARLFFLAPAIQAVLVMLWLASAWLGFAHGDEATRQLVSSLGLPADLADPLRIGSSALDIAVAGLVLFDRKARWSTMVQLAVVAGYTLVIGLALPGLWSDPLGPLLKNLPIMLLVLVYGAIGDKR